MVRGATPYGLRGTPLVLPNGSAANPALRFGRARSGLYRLPSGSISLVVNKLITATLDGAQNLHGANNLTAVNNIGAGVQSPQVRVHVWTGIQNDGVTLSTTQPAAANPPNELLFRAINDPSIGSQDRGTYFGLVGTATRLTGGSLPGDAAISTEGARSGRLLLGSRANTQIILDAAGNGIQFMQNLTELARLTWVGNLGVGFGAPETRLQIRSGFQYDGLTIATNNPSESGRSPIVRLRNHALQASVTQEGWLGLALAPTTFFTGSLAGDLCLASAGGGAAGRLLLGSRGQNQVIVDSNVGLQFLDNGTERARLTTPGGVAAGGRLGLGVTAPAYRIHTLSGFKGDGITMFAASQASGNSPHFRLGEALASSTRDMVLGLALAAGDYLGTLAIGDVVLMTAGAAGGNLVLGARGVGRQTITPAGSFTFQLGAAQASTFYRSDAVPIFSISDAGIQTTKVSPADPVAGWQQMPVIITATGNTPPGIAFHRAGFTVRTLYELSGLPYWNGSKIWTDANNATTSNIAAGSIPASALVPSSITGAQIANGTITGAEVGGNTLTHGNMAAQAIHNPLVTYIGPPSTPYDHVANSAWHDIPGLTTPLMTGIGGANPAPTDDFFYEMWAECSVAHSAGGHLWIRIIFLRQVDSVIIFADQSPATASGVAGGTTWPTTSQFAVNLHTVATGLFQPGYFRVQIISDVAGTVRVFTNESRFRVWVSKR